MGLNKLKKFLCNFWLGRIQKILFSNVAMQKVLKMATLKS